MKRVLLKLSGEALAGEKKTGFDEETVRGVALQVKKIVELGTEVGIVIGGEDEFLPNSPLFVFFVDVIDASNGSHRFGDRSRGFDDLALSIG